MSLRSWQFKSTKVRPTWRDLPRITRPRCGPPPVIVACRRISGFFCALVTKEAHLYFPWWLQNEAHPSSMVTKWSPSLNDGYEHSLPYNTHSDHETKPIQEWWLQTMLIFVFPSWLKNEAHPRMMVTKEAHRFPWWLQNAAQYTMIQTESVSPMVFYLHECSSFMTRAQL